MNVFCQLIGFGALIAMGLSYWQDDKRTILLWQVVANLIFAVHYTLLHARSGALCSFFQIVVAGVCHWGTVVFRHGDGVSIDYHHGGVPAEEGIQKALNGQTPGTLRRGSLPKGCAASGVVLQPLRHG